ncbi:MAG: hypothetical protein DI535_03380 [Citrobacter freundii]|nr:MAG: hypothetical protein DI535_03380 [Citrobacter freundii]
MKRLYVVMLIFVSLVSFHCQKEVSYAGLPVDKNGVSADPVTATLQGNVVDENNVPATGVLIKVGNKTILTDERGYFRIIHASLDKTASVVIAEKTGYFKAYRTFQASDAANNIKIRLTKREAVGTISAGGGEVVLSNGAKIALPAGGVMKAAGGAYEGDVKVFAAFIDPTSAEIGTTMPGSFMADDASGKRVMLASFGMLAVELESPSGEKLQVATDKEAILTFPIPASLQQAAPASISLWYVDEKTGIWKEEGKATRNGNNFTGTVKHFSFWNCDISVPMVSLSFTLQNEKGLPFVHTSVRLKAFVNGGPSISYGFTDSLGKINGMVPAGQALTMEVLNDQCNQPVYTKTIGPFTASTDLGKITVTSVTNSIVMVTGKLVNCNGAAVTNGSALISFQNTSAYVSTDQNGVFSYVYVKCDDNPQTISVLGIDNETVQQGSSNNFSVTSSTLNTGTLNACGVSAAQFVSYKVDGTDYMIANSVADSLVAYSYAQQQPAGFVTFISGSNYAAGKIINVSFDHTKMEAGTYPVKALYLNQFGSVVPESSAKVVVTSYPQTSGQFIEGSFSGQFRDSLAQDPLHTFSGSFRIRKY